MDPVFRFVRHCYVLVRQRHHETQRGPATTEAGNPYGRPSVPRDDNCGVCVDGTHVADWAFPLREGEIDGETVYGRYPTRVYALTGRTGIAML